MKHQEIEVGVIHPNPHRDFKRNPIRKEQVERLVDSIGRTGFWDNVVVRPHPDKKGHFQLAYGHSRLEAIKKCGIKTVRLPVADLSDWDMYVSMVDENETQQEVTPAIAFENVETGVKLLEAAFEKIGKEGSEESFYKALGRVVSRDTTRDPSRDGHGFEQARNAYHNGEGLGRNWVARILPGSARSNTISEVLNSHYGKQREAAAKKKAEAKRREAAAKEKEARAAKDREAAAKALKAAKEAEAEADALERDAKKIGGKSIDAEILLQFDTPYQMTEFAAAVKNSGVDKEHHAAAADHVIKRGLSGRQMVSAIDSWWYDVSGQRERDRKRNEKKAEYDRFMKRWKGGDIKATFDKLRSDIRQFTGNLQHTMQAAAYLQDDKLRRSTTDELKRLRDVVNAALSALSEPLDDSDIIEGEVVSRNGSPARLTHVG